MLIILTAAAVASAVPPMPTSCKAGGSIADGYAAAASWYVNNEPIVIGKRTYVKYGLPRALHPSDVIGLTVYHGANVYREPRVKLPADVIYVLVGVTYPGEKADGYDCEYQPYEKR